MKEAYCSYEISKLLKEKGFDECIFEFYEGDKIKYARNDEGFRLSELPDTYYPHITHQMTMAWLREVHNIFIEISVSIDLNSNYHYSYFILNKECKYVRKGYTDFDWNYEDAVESAIKYCLEKLI